MVKDVHTVFQTPFPDPALPRLIIDYSITRDMCERIVEYLPLAINQRDSENKYQPSGRIEQTEKTYRANAKAGLG